MPLLGNVAEKQKISYGFTKIHLGVRLATSDRMHLHTFVDRERKRSKNGDDVVVLDVIQITDDQRRTDGTSAFNTRTGRETSPPS